MIRLSSKTDKSSELWIIGTVLSFFGYYVMALLIEHKRIQNETKKKFVSHCFLLFLASAVFVTSLWGYCVFSSASSLLAPVNSIKAHGNIFSPINKCFISNTAIGLVVGMFTIFSALFIASRDHFYCSTNDQRVEILRTLYSQRLRRLSLRELKLHGKKMVRIEALLQKTRHQVVAGVLFGAITLLLRLLPFHVDQSVMLISLRWAPLIGLWFFSSLFFSIGLWILFRVLAWKKFERLRLCGVTFLWSATILVDQLSIFCITLLMPESSAVQPSPQLLLQAHLSPFLLIFALVVLLLLCCVLLILLELREAYVCVEGDFVKVINLMDAAYVSAHSTRNFERAFENFINFALPLMANHTKCTEIEAGLYEMSSQKMLTRRSLSNSKSNMELNSSKMMKRTNKKLARVLGRSGATQGKIFLHSPEAGTGKKSLPYSINEVEPIPSPLGTSLQSIDEAGVMRIPLKKPMLFPKLESTISRQGSCFQLDTRSRVGSADFSGTEVPPPTTLLTKLEPIQSQPQSHNPRKYTTPHNTSLSAAINVCNNRFFFNENADLESPVSASQILQIDSKHRFSLAAECTGKSSHLFEHVDSHRNIMDVQPVSNFSSKRSSVLIQSDLTNIHQGPRISLHSTPGTPTCTNPYNLPFPLESRSNSILDSTRSRNHPSFLKRLPSTKKKNKSRKKLVV